MKKVLSKKQFGGFAQAALEEKRKTKVVKVKPKPKKNK